MKKTDSKCAIAAQAICAGMQEVRVTGVGPAVAGAGREHIVVRIGRVLVYVEDRAALDSFQDGWQQAAAYADVVFGPAPVSRAPGRR